MINDDKKQTDKNDQGLELNAIRYERLDHPHQSFVEWH